MYLQIKFSFYNNYYRHSNITWHYFHKNKRFYVTLFYSLAVLEPVLFHVRQEYKEPYLVFSYKSKRHGTGIQ
jgi:hypothetical protein